MTAFKPCAPAAAEYILHDQNFPAGCFRAARWKNRGGAEHHFEKFPRIKRPIHFTANCALAQHGYPVTQRLDIFQLMGNQDDAFALDRQFLESIKKNLFLGAGNAGGGLIQDQHLDAAGHEPDNFKLLALSDGQCF